jgi:hypothetical protein
MEKILLQFVSPFGFSPQSKVWWGVISSSSSLGERERERERESWGQEQLST